MTPHLIICRGNNRKIAERIVQLGFLFGSRSDHYVGGVRCDGLVDINWKKYLWKSHLKFVAAHHPLLGAVPDVVRFEEMSKVLEMIKDITPLCTHPLVIPKIHGVISKVPKGCVIGVSVPSSYAGFYPRVDELHQRKIHLLGGTPHKQFELVNYYKHRKVQIFSVDGNAVFLAASYGKRWSKKLCSWVKDDSLDYQELIERSLVDWRAAWESMG